MKRIFALFVLLLALIACSSSAPPRAPDVTAWREFELTLHADDGFTDVGRARLQEAAQKWRDASGGRIRITVIFDVDFSSVENLKEHQAASHSLLLGVLSDYTIAKTIDEKLGAPGKVPMAATMTGEEDPTIVILILDRITVGDFLSVATHELGHVAGMPDLPSFGSVMSGARRKGEPSVETFTAEDVALCRSARLCP